MSCVAQPRECVDYSTQCSTPRLRCRWRESTSVDQWRRTPISLRRPRVGGSSRTMANKRAGSQYRGFRGSRAYVRNNDCEIRQHYRAQRANEKPPTTHEQQSNDTHDSHAHCHGVFDHSCAAIIRRRWRKGCDQLWFHAEFASMRLVPTPLSLRRHRTNLVALNDICSSPCRNGTATA